MVNINTATASELQALPEIGQVTAQRIVEYSEGNGRFETVEELQEVPRIGPKTLEGMRDLVTVGR